MDSRDLVKAQLMDSGDLDRMLARMARQIAEQMDLEAAARTALIGMQTRGVYLARRLQEKILQFEGIELPLGILDVTMYRDDFHSRGRTTSMRATRIPFDVTDRHLVLIDDVLYTGRTARAAMDALMDMGRPASIRLLIVVDRGWHELPIRADIVGRDVPTIPGEEVRVRVQEYDGIDGIWLVQSPPEARGSENETLHSGQS